MRIIKEKPKKPENIITCFSCQCKFKYERKDIKVDGIGREYVDCPKCSMDIKL